MALADSLLSAIVRADGDALVMHVGERPYVVVGTNPLHISTHELTLDTTIGMMSQLLPPETLATLEEFGAVEYRLPDLGDDRFNVVAARGGDDIWIEIRRRRQKSDAAVAAANERRQAEEEAVAAQRAAEEAEQQRLAAEAAAAEEQRRAEEAAAIEEQRRAEEERRLAAEAAALEEERRRAAEEEQRRVAEEEQRRAAEEEERRLAAEAAALEEQRRAEEAAAIEEQRRAEEERRLAAEAAAREEEQRRAAEEEQRRAAEEEERRLAAEAAALEEQRRAQEAAAIEEQRRAEEERRLAAEAAAREQEQRRAAEEEQRRAAEEEERRLAAEAAALEEQRRAQEAAAIEEQRRAEQERRLAAEAAALEEEQRRAAEDEQRRLEEERRLAAAAAALEEQRRLEEERRLAAEAAALEEQRRAQEAAALEGRRREAEEERRRIAEQRRAAEAAAIEEERRSAEAAIEEAQRAADAMAEEAARAAASTPPHPMVAASREAPLVDEHAAPQPLADTGDAVERAEPLTLVPMTRTVRIEVPPRTPPSRSTDIERLLRLASARGASSLFVTSESRPYIRVDGDIRQLEGEPVLSRSDVEAAIVEIAPESGREPINKGEATEWLREYPELGRIRCTTFNDHRGPGVILRMIATRAATAESLGLPREVQALATESQGLVLVAGPRASGKSTLMSALVDLVNRQRAEFVITLERQIRLVHDNKAALVSQREIRGGADEALAAARSALREGPDVLVVDDLISPHMVPLILTAASEGLLVFVSIAAPSTSDAVQRFIELASPERRGAVQGAMAESFRGAVAQTLLKKTGGGLIAAREVLLATAPVARVISEGQLAQLPHALESGRKHGMQSFAETLVDYVRGGSLDVREAFRKAPDRDRLLAALKREKIDTSLVERLA